MFGLILLHKFSATSWFKNKFEMHLQFERKMRLKFQIQKESILHTQQPPTMRHVGVVMGHGLSDLFTAYQGL